MTMDDDGGTDGGNAMYDETTSSPVRTVQHVYCTVPGTVITLPVQYVHSTVQ